MVRKKKEYLWERKYPQGVEWDININPRPLYSLLEKSAEKYPDNICTEFEGKTHTYLEISEFANKMAEGLQGLGVKKGDRIGLLLPNCPYYIVAYYAILKIGAIIVNFSPLYSINELSKQVKDSGIKILVTIDHRELYEKTSNLLQTTPLEKAIIGSLEKMLPFPKDKLFKLFKGNQIAAVSYGKVNIELESFFELSGNYQYVNINPLEDIAALQYTGGTTGEPKGAILTHANLYMNAVQCSLWFAGIEEGKEKIMAVLPFFHVFAMTAVMNFAIYNALALILMPKFSINQLIRDIHKKRPTLMPGVPTLFAAINNSKKLKGFDLTSLKACVSGGAPLPVAIREQFEAIASCKLIEGYGLTESSPVVSANPLIGDNKTGSIGMPLPGTVIEIRHVEGGGKKLVKDGEIGEICVIGPQVMQGYWNNEKENKEVLRGNRLHTGDLGYMDEDGYIFVVDRLKEVVIISGFNVYPREIEELLYKHTSISEAAVIGLPDEYKGQKLKAFIKLRLGEELSQEKVTDYLKGKLAKYKVPEEIEFVKELPKTMIGKVDKKKLSSGSDKRSNI